MSRIARLVGGELDEARALLDASRLPSGDLTVAVELVGERDAVGLAGVAGLERCGRVGLLRSLAVRTDRRGTGLGGALVGAIEQAAAGEGIEALYLLTTTAEAFFARRGYTRVSREAAPPAIRRTSEFSEICPVSSAFMVKPLA